MKEELDFKMRDWLSYFKW